MNMAQKMRERAITIKLMTKPVVERRSELWLEVSSLVCLSNTFEIIFCLFIKERRMGLRIPVT